MKIYVGNLAFTASEDALRRKFAEYGEVSSARIIMDRETGRSRGFAFVEMNNDGEASNAISALNGFELDGRALRVNEARPMEPRSNDRERRPSRDRNWR